MPAKTVFRQGEPGEELRSAAVGSPIRQTLRRRFLERAQLASVSSLVGQGVGRTESREAERLRLGRGLQPAGCNPRGPLFVGLRATTQWPQPIGRQLVLEVAPMWPYHTVEPPSWTYWPWDWRAPIVA